jgi:polar amino acid transport system substrate-binding protein
MVARERQATPRDGMDKPGGNLHHDAMFIKRSVVTTILVAASVLFIAAAKLVGAEASPGAPQAIRVGVAPVSPPMIFKEGRTITGVEADFARELSRHLGRPVEFVELVWEDLIDSLVEGKIDIIMSSMSVTRARETRVAFCDPYLRIGQMALVRAEDKYRFTILEGALAKRTIGVKKGTTADLMVQQEFPRAKRKYYKSGDEGAKALAKKQIDMFITDSTVVSYLAGIYESKSLVKAPMVFSDEVLGWAVKRNDDSLRQSVNAYLKKARENGEMTRILQRWIPRLQ